MRARLAIALLLAGCGGAEAPLDDARNDNTGRHAGGEACAERTPAAPVAAPLAGLDGRWFLLEPGGEDVEMVLELAGATGRAWGEDPSEALPVTVRTRPDGVVEVGLAMPGDDERAMRIFLFPRGPGNALAVATGEGDARIARRAAPVPAFLEGRWIVADPRGREPAMPFDIRGDRAEAMIDGAPRSMQLYGLAPDGPTIDLVAQRPEGGDVEWLRLQPVSPDVLIVRIGDDEEYRVMHREGAAPAWLGELGGPRPFEPASATAPPP